MVQYAVTLKDGDWTVFKDGEPVTSGLSRSAAVDRAEELAFDAEARGLVVELLIQHYSGELTRKPRSYSPASATSTVSGPARSIARPKIIFTRARSTLPMTASLRR